MEAFAARRKLPAFPEGSLWRGATKAKRRCLFKGGDHMNFSGFGVADLLPFIAICFVAQAVDCAPGTASGVISNTFLISLGVPPAIGSARVHIVEAFTAAASGIRRVLHKNGDRWRFGPSSASC